MEREKEEEEEEEGKEKVEGVIMEEKKRDGGAVKGRQRWKEYDWWRMQGNQSSHRGSGCLDRAARWSR